MRIDPSRSTAQSLGLELIEELTKRGMGASEMFVGLDRDGDEQIGRHELGSALRHLLRLGDEQTRDDELEAYEARHHSSGGRLHSGTHTHAFRHGSSSGHGLSHHVIHGIFRQIDEDRCGELSLGP